MPRTTKLRRKLLKHEAIRAGNVQFVAEKAVPVTVHAPENVAVTHLDANGKPKKGKK